jgi:hypothetical protein
VKKGARRDVVNKHAARKARDVRKSANKGRSNSFGIVILALSNFYRPTNFHKPAIPAGRRTIIAANV